MMSAPRVRIAPSPTGPVHVGTARTALLNFLFARKHGGTFIVRIEDTDRARSREEYTTQLLEGLRWLGLEWDEGPGRDGPHGPYIQSQRLSLYQDAIRRLLETDAAYKKDGAVVFRVPPRTEPYRVEDLIRGTVEVPVDQLSDFVIAKPKNEPQGDTGTQWDPLFHLSVVVDDGAMNITHVLRGEDHLSNTPKHLLLQEALGLPTPAYGHLPLLLDTARHKLSKRTGTTSLLSYREQGYLPEALANFLALLGWNPKTDEEVFTIPDLIERFDLNGIQKGGAVFDLRKLDWLQRQHLLRLSPGEMYSRAAPVLIPLLPEVEDPSRQELVTRALEIWRPRGGAFSQSLETVTMIVARPERLSPELLPWKDTDRATTSNALVDAISIIDALPADAWGRPETLQAAILEAVDGSSWERAPILWPMRVALSGQRQSPGPGELAWALGREETRARLEQAQRLLTMDTTT